MDGEAGAAQGPEGAEDVETEDESDETDEGETEVSVGHYAGQVASVPVEQTGPLRVRDEVSLCFYGIRAPYNRSMEATLMPKRHMQFMASPTSRSNQ